MSEKLSKVTENDVNPATSSLKDSLEKAIRKSSEQSMGGSPKEKVEFNPAELAQARGVLESYQNATRHEDLESGESDPIDIEDLKEQVRAQYESIKETLDEIRTVDNESGEALTSSYDNEFKGFIDAINRYESGEGSEDELHERAASLQNQIEKIYDRYEELARDFQSSKQVSEETEPLGEVLPEETRDALYEDAIKRNDPEAYNNPVFAERMQAAAGEPGFTEVSVEGELSPTSPTQPEPAQPEVITEPSVLLGEIKGPRQDSVHAQVTEARLARIEEQLTSPHLSEEARADLEAQRQKLEKELELQEPQSAQSAISPEPIPQEKSKEGIEKEITDLQAELGPKSAALYAARAEAEQKVLEGRKGLNGWFKKQLTKGGFGGAIDTEQFDEASKAKIAAAEKEYGELASQLEQKLDERTEARFRERMTELSDDQIRERIEKKKYAMKTRGVSADKIPDESVEQYRARMEGKLGSLKAAARFQGIYLKQAEVDRELFVQSLPPQERAKVMEMLDKVRAWNKKYRHVRIIGTAAALTGAAVMTGGVAATMTPVALLFGGKVARAYGGIGVGLAAAGATHRVIGHIGKNKIEKNKSEQTKDEIEAIRKANVAEAEKQERAQKIIDEKARAEKRLKVRQMAGAAVAGVAAGAGFAYEAGAAGLGRVEHPNGAAGSWESQPEAQKSAVSLEISAEQQTPEVQAALAHDPPGRQMFSPRVLGAENIQETTSTKPISLEGKYAQGSSITREIDNWLKKSPMGKDLTDTQRARVAYRIALDEMKEMRDNPKTESQWNIRGHDPHRVGAGDTFKAELDPDRVKEHIDRVTHGAPVEAGSGTSAEHHVEHGGGKPHRWIGESPKIQDPKMAIGTMMNRLGNEFGFDTKFWAVMHGENIARLQEMANTSDSSELEAFAESKGQSVETIRDMLARIEVLSDSSHTPIGPLDTTDSLVERAASTRVGKFLDPPMNKPQTVKWLSDAPTKPAAPSTRFSQLEMQEPVEQVPPPKGPYYPDEPARVMLTQNDQSLSRGASVLERQRLYQEQLRMRQQYGMVGVGRRGYMGQGVAPGNQGSGFGFWGPNRLPGYYDRDGNFRMNRVPGPQRTMDVRVGIGAGVRTGWQGNSWYR